MKKVVGAFQPGAAIKFKDSKKMWAEVEAEKEVDTPSPVLPVPDGRIVQGDTIIERTSPPGAKRATWKTSQKEE